MLELLHRITRDKQGTYYTLPFEVPCGVVSIRVTYSYPHGKSRFMGLVQPSNTVDIGLEDEQGHFIGWSGSAHSSITVGEYGSSKGYITKKINPGTWRIIVGAYHIEQNGVTVKYNIDFEYEKKQWLYGDLHIHSTASDGKLDAYMLCKAAKKKGLDFIALANHNNFAENFNLPKEENFTFIPAVEWTHYKGHMNFFGVENPFADTFIANDEDGMRTIVSQAKRLGAVISVNHAKCPVCPYLWEDNECFDMVEIWNGPMTGRNLRATDWWTEFLRSGRRLPAIGGSDYHKTTPVTSVGRPTTAVFSNSRSAADILDALSSGHAYITNKVGGTALRLEYDEKIMGDSVKRAPGKKLYIKGERLCGAALMLVTDKGESRLSKGFKNTVEVNVDISDERFAYIKAVKGVGALRIITAVSNPVYFED